MKFYQDCSRLVLPLIERSVNLANMKSSSRVTQNGLKPSREKVRALKECSEPSTKVAFHRLKESLKEETSLAYFVPNQPICVHVDAGKKMESTSNVPGGLCAILTQQDEKDIWRMCNVANEH